MYPVMILKCFTIFTYLLFISCENTYQKESMMTDRDEFLTTFKEFDVEDEEQKDSIAEKVVAASMEIPQLLSQLSHSDTAKTSRKGKALLLRIGAVALTPLLENVSPAEDPDRYAWDIEQIADLHFDVQDRLIIILQNALMDKRPLTVKQMPPQIEEKPDLMRVCDKAYLILRKLLSFESSESAMVNEREYLHHRTEQERDKEIERWMENKNWISLVERSFE
jgi:hypothetical protein